MSDFDDWNDPFAADEEAAARERRRAERAARRRAEQGSLADRVAEQQSAVTPPLTRAEPEPPPFETGPADAVEAPPAPAPAASPPPPAEPAPPTPDPAPPSLSSAATPPDQGLDPPTELQPMPAGASRPPLTRPRRRAPVAPGGGSHRELIVRRVVGLLFLVALIAIVVFGVTKVLDSLGEEEPPQVKAEPVKVQDVLIPEGLDRRQIATEVEKSVKGDYLQAAKQAPKGFDLAKYGGQGAPNLEGFLFPATYELERDAKAEDLVLKQLDAFRANLAEVDLSYAKDKNLTVYDVVKIASMVEREIQVPEERELASAVIYNRLAADSPLGIDATIRYYLNNYDEQLTESELADDHAYNSRTNTGLPPTPISNPGLASLEAAANPADSDAFYFVVKPGTCGEHVFVETEEEFFAAEAEYQAALQEQGGSPTEC